MPPARVTATTIASSLSASGIAVGFSAVAMSICTLFCSIGVMTMKMMSSTSITSTIGVTLMLELTFLPSSRTVIPMEWAPSELCRRIESARAQRQAARRRSNRRPQGSSPCGRHRFSPGKKAELPLVALLDEVVEKFARGVVHLHVEGLNTSGEVVEGHHGGNRHQQAERGGHQRLRNTAGDCADAGSLLGCDRV